MDSERYSKRSGKALGQVIRWHGKHALVHLEEERTVFWAWQADPKLLHARAETAGIRAGAQRKPADIGAIGNVREEKTRITAQALLERF